MKANDFAIIACTPAPARQMRNRCSRGKILGNMLPFSADTATSHKDPQPKSFPATATFLTAFDFVSELGVCELQNVCAKLLFCLGYGEKFIGSKLRRVSPTLM